MNKKKVENLYELFKKEVREVLQNGESNAVRSIPLKITQILTNSKKHGWGIHNDLQEVRETFLRDLGKDQVKSLWYEDLNTKFKGERDEKLNKVIRFYIDRFNLNDDEKEYYQKLQRKEFEIMKENKRFEMAKKDLLWDAGAGWKNICEYGTDEQYNEIKRITEEIVFSEDMESLNVQAERLANLLKEFGEGLLESVEDTEGQA